MKSDWKTLWTNVNLWTFDDLWIMEKIKNIWWSDIINLNLFQLKLIFLSMMMNEPINYWAMMKMDEDRGWFFWRWNERAYTQDESPIFFGYVPMQSWQSYCFKIKNSLINNFWFLSWLLHILFTCSKLLRMKALNLSRFEKTTERQFFEASKNIHTFNSYTFEILRLHICVCHHTTSLDRKKKIGVTQWTQKYYLGEKGTSS